jgi:branched-subunit amino acid transport protein
MNTLVVFVAAGAVSWLLRAAFVVGLRSDAAAARAETIVRYAAPAALAALTVTSVDVAASRADQPRWMFVAAAVVAAIATWRIRNLTVAILAGALAITAFTAF